MQTLHKGQINNDLDRYKSTGDFPSETVDQLPLAFCDLQKQSATLLLLVYKKEYALHERSL